MQYKSIYKFHAINTIIGVACMLSVILSEILQGISVSVWWMLPISVWLLTNWEKKHTLGVIPEIRLMYFTAYPYRYIATFDLHFLWALVAGLGIIKYGYVHGQVGLGVLFAIHYALIGVVFNGEREMHEPKEEEKI